MPIGNPGPVSYPSVVYHGPMIKLPSELVGRLRPRYADRRVCVTGGAGFIGGHLVDVLFGLDARISVIDDLSSSTLDHLAGLIEIEPERTRFVHASILEDEPLAQAFAGAEVVFHLAAIGSVPRSIDEPERTWAVNADGTLRVLEAARRAGVKRVVLAASSSAYGDTEVLPKVESMTPNPTSPYGISKLAAELLARVWSETYGLDTASLRYFNVFGPRQHADSGYAAVVPAFAKRLLAGQRPVIFGDGQQTRDFTFVTNAVVATLLAGARPEPLAGAVINVGSGTRTSVLELAQLMAEQLVESDDTMAHEPEHRPMRTGDVEHSLADISLARKVLDYEPVVTLRHGLAEACVWYRQTMSTAAGNRE